MTPDVSTGKVGKAQTSLHTGLNAKYRKITRSAGLVRVVTLRVAYMLRHTHFAVVFMQMI